MVGVALLVAAVLGILLWVERYEAGVDRACTILREQLNRSMALSGFRSIPEIQPGRVTRR